MSVETIAILTLVVTIIVGGFAGFGWVVRRMDAATDGVRSELRTAMAELRGEVNGLRGEFNGLRGEFNGLRGEFNGLRGEFNELRKDVNGVRGELTEVKIAIARIEGPPRHLVSAR